MIVDIRRTETANIADEFVQIKPGGDYAVLSALRHVRGKRDDTETVVGVTREQLSGGRPRKEAKFGAVYFGWVMTQEI